MRETHCVQGVQRAGGLAAWNAHISQTRTSSFKIAIYLKGTVTDSEGEAETKRYRPSCWSLPGLGQADARTLELHQGLPCG